MAAARSFRFLRPVAVRFRLSYLVSLFFKFKFKFEIRMGCVMLSYIEFIFICYMKALRGIKSSVELQLRSAQRPAASSQQLPYSVIF
jgi:hypothetical protein